MTIELKPYDSLKNMLTKERITVVVILLFGFLLRAAFLKKEFIADEIDFVLGGRDVSRIGYPAVFGDGMDHPPLAVSLYAFSFLIFGISEQSARIVPITFSLATSVVIYLICLHINPSQSRRRYVGLIALLSYSINPYVIQSSILIDIDQILTFFTTTLLYIFLKCEENFKWKYISIGSFALFLALFTRLETPIVLLIGVIVYYLIIRQPPRKGYIPIFLICFLGSLLFLVSWSSYCVFFNLNPLYPLIKNQEHLIELEGGLNLWFWPLANILSFVRWYTIPLGIVSILSLLFAFKMKRTASYFILIAFWSLIPFIAFGFFSAPFGFPKYFIPAIAPLSILLDSYISEQIHRIKNRSNLGHLIFVSCVITLIFFSLQLFQWKPTPDVLTYFQFFLVPFFIILPLFIVTLLRQKVIKFKDTPIKTTYIVSLTLFAFIYASGMTGIFLTSNASTHYWMGITGIKETGLYLESHTQKTDILIVPKDVGYYSNRTFFPCSMFVNGTTIQYKWFFFKLITEKEIAYFAYAPRFHYFPQEYLNLLEEVSYQKIVIGDFLIYQLE
ncbi:MAG: glycosyltransferase family 39 protein [Promethearchaeota archaeon]